ncbi:MAG: F0F1 ATP synthase subunit gamma, partial [Muribaculaceae bacterium]|nr:F0F1 ATP synthase subunit gamma [Muribaculaceae bacterium]
MATLRELKARIGSVASTEKITGAMKMISSAKMHKAELSIKQLRPYRSQIETIIANLLSADIAVESPLMTVREVACVAIIVWGSDNGLCGGYNMNLYKQIVATIAELREKYGQTVKLTIIPVGSKIAKPVQKLTSEGVEVATDYNVDSKSDEATVKAFTERLQQEFLDGVYDKIEAVSTQFLSVSRQRIASVQFLPIEAASLSSAAESGDAKIKPYIFAPDVESILRPLLTSFQKSVIQDILKHNIE